MSRVCRYEHCDGLVYSWLDREYCSLPCRVADHGNRNAWAEYNRVLRQLPFPVKPPVLVEVAPLPEPAPEPSARRGWFARWRAAAVVLLISSAALAGCGTTGTEAKTTAATQPAPVSGEFYRMPFDFPGIVTTCIHGTRVFTTYHNGLSYGASSLALSVVPNDPTCQMP